MKFFIFCYYDSFDVLEFLSAIWTSFIAYFGGKPTNKSIDNQTTYKIVLFTSLLCGSLVWMFYRGYLSSNLSFTIKKLPFTDLKSLSKTNWRYIVILVIEILSHPIILESDCKIHCPFLCEMLFFVINIQQNLRLLNFRKNGCVLTELAL